MAKRLVLWNGEEFTHAIQQVAQDSLDAMADLIVDEAMASQRAMDLIDTYFSLNSYYRVSPGGSTYDNTPPSGFRSSRRRPGAILRRTRSPEVEPPDNMSAIVANTATYFVWLERRYSLLFNAMNEIKEVEVGAIMTKLADEQLG